MAPAAMSPMGPIGPIGPMPAASAGSVVAGTRRIAEIHGEAFRATVEALDQQQAIVPAWLAAIADTTGALGLRERRPLGPAALDALLAAYGQ